MERCEEITRQLDELEREAPTAALREEVRQMKREVEAIRRAFFRADGIRCLTDRLRP